MPMDSNFRDAKALLNQQAAWCTDEVCPSFWVLPELMAMIRERRNEPAERLRPTIRRMLAEHAFACPSDSMPAASEAGVIEAQVDRLVQVLEQVRRQALARGEWSPWPAAPMMCG